VSGLRSFAGRVRGELAFYSRLLSHPRTPRAARVLLRLAVGYLLLPFDLVPDFVPVLGHLDDVVIVPVLVIAATRLVPDDVIAECRGAAVTGHGGGRSTDA